MVDPRAHHPEKLVPPAPLPYVSRKALRRVKNPLPVPTKCRYCGGKVELVNHREIYDGREFGGWPYAYWCRPCDAYVGLHPDTDIPLGTLANAELREARRLEKHWFERLWRRGAGDWKEQRTAAYGWLAAQMGIEVGQCHFAWFDLEQCRIAGALCQARLQAEGWR